MDKITITRALSELKLLDSRIRKEINGSLFVDLYRKRDSLTIVSKRTLDEFKAKTLGNYESINKLIARRYAMKAAIMASNSSTMVKIGDKSMCVAEAIDKKNAIEYERELLTKMRLDFTEGKTQIDDTRASLEEQVEKMLVQNLGVEKKVAAADYENIAKPFLEQNEFNIVDPLGIEKKIDELEKEIDVFTTEVDFVLSESNARTEIAV